MHVNAVDMQIVVEIYMTCINLLNEGREEEL